MKRRKASGKWHEMTAKFVHAQISTSPACTPPPSHHGERQRSSGRSEVMLSKFRPSGPTEVEHSPNLCACAMVRHIALGTDSVIRWGGKRRKDTNLRVIFTVGAPSRRGRELEEEERERELVIAPGETRASGFSRTTVVYNKEQDGGRLRGAICPFPSFPRRE